MSTFFHNCSILDYVIIAVSLFMVLNGFRRGCSGEIGRLIGIAAGAAVLIFGRAAVAGQVATWPVIGQNLFAMRLVSLILMLALSVAVWLLVGHFLGKLIKLAFNQPVDAILGGIFGVAKSILLIVMLCTYGIMGPRTERTKSEPSMLSKLSTVIDRITPWVKATEPSGPKENR